MAIFSAAQNSATTILKKEKTKTMVSNSYAYSIAASTLFKIFRYYESSPIFRKTSYEYDAVELVFNSFKNILKHQNYILCTFSKLCWKND